VLVPSLRTTSFNLLIGTNGPGAKNQNSTKKEFNSLVILGAWIIGSTGMYVFLMDLLLTSKLPSGL
jgi:F0F1-type ATP synthase membrane subunit c/vacuolar-type H+-ATPase subunit K